MFRLLMRFLVLISALSLAFGGGVFAQTLPRDALAKLIVPPFSLGEALSEDGVWTILNSGGADAGYVFETQPLAPIPGFSGEPVNVLVTLDLEGGFIDAQLLNHNEPVFVSGLGQAPFHEFVRQYRGHSISDTMTVGVPYGAGDTSGDLVYLNGVTKATASVRIAHESILAAALSVARERMKGISAGPPPRPDPDYQEVLDWPALIEKGLAQRRLITNAEAQAAFAGTLFEDDDPEALEDPDAPYLDLWIVDLGPPAIARAALDDDTLAELQQFMSISTFDEPILVLDAGRHGLVGESFIRNTSPDLLTAHQDGFPVALRDADLFIGLAEGAPEAEHAIILRTDRRLGFDPSRDWELSVRAVRKHGSFMPQIGSVDFVTTHKTDERFYLRPTVPKPMDPRIEAALARSPDLAILALGLGVISWVLLQRMSAFAGLPAFTPVRLGILAAMIGFVGYWGQGQLSIVTVLGVMRALFEQRSFDFLLYDPFSLLIWLVVIISFVVWGRGLFCGWLCPYGAMQEFSHHIGKFLGLPQIRVRARWDRRLKYVKYVVLAVLIGAAFLASGPVSDKLVEVEPFKTAITVSFVREWPYVVYALLWLFLGLFVFKSFCRYVCPLGAVMAIGGLLRRKDWIARRAECGTPCQLCTVKCKYGAIEKTGKVRYDECFQCLDCVTIHDDPKVCVPLILASRKQAA